MNFTLKCHDSQACASDRYLHHLLITKFLKYLQNIYTCIPIDAEFYADFKNAYFCIPILQIFWVMASFMSKKARFGKTGIFSLWIAITQNSTGYFDLQVFWEYILIVRMYLSRFPWFKTKIFRKMDLIKLFSPYFHTFSIGKRPRTEISLTTPVPPLPRS